jgi:TRAP-type C4-dicarboxylate transport system permease small subunit
MLGTQTWLENTANAFAAVSCALLVMVAISDVVSRPLGLTSSFSVDYGVFLNAILIFLPLGVNTRKNTHISADFFVLMIPNRAQRIFHCFNKIVFLVVATALLYLCAKFTLTTYWDGTRSLNVPWLRLWVPQMAMVLGLALLWIRLAVQIFAVGQKKSKD